MDLNNELKLILELLNKEALIKDSISKMYLIGKNNHDIIQNDIDFVVFINDTVSKYEFVKIFTEIIQDYILLNKILINCFPIHFKYMSSGHSMFIDNVLNYGKEITL